VSGVSLLTRIAAVWGEDSDEYRAVSTALDALKPFADAHMAAMSYGITMTAADLGVLAARHLSFVHFTKAAVALARAGGAK
jgi:hypothetical protein